MSPDNPNKFVYDIELPETTVRERFKAQMDLLHELCCYGSNLIVRCFRERENKFEDFILVVCLLRQFLVHLDAAFVLLSKGAVEATNLHLRAMLEEEIYLNWLVKLDTANRARHLYVWNLRKRRGWNRVVDPTTPEAQRIDAIVGSDFPNVVARQRNPEMQAEAVRQNADIDRILSQPEFAAINAAFDAARNGRPFDVEWFKPCGPRSIAAIAKDVGMATQYYVFYSKWSESMHSSGFFDHFHADDLGASIEQVRSMEGIGNAIAMANAFAHGVFRLFIKRYRPGEEVAFNLKYMNEWRGRAMNIPKITINRRTQA